MKFLPISTDNDLLLSIETLAATSSPYWTGYSGSQIQVSWASVGTATSY